MFQDVGVLIQVQNVPELGRQHLEIDLSLTDPPILMPRIVIFLFFFICYFTRVSVLAACADVNIIISYISFFCLTLHDR